MAGHSKWANIKHKKGANDSKRAKLYTKLIKEISVATREGGEDINSNSRLRVAIQNAKGANVPKDTIERAIQKASGSGDLNYFSLSYEGYGPGGIAFLVECMTDNTNRTVSSIRSIFSKNNGSITKNGSISHLFDRKGIFVINKDTSINKDALVLDLIDAGATDIENDENNLYLTCSVQNFGNIQKTLENLEIEPMSAHLEYFPKSYIHLNDSEAIKALKLIDSLEDDDDVQKVYHNLYITDEQEHLLK